MADDGKAEAITPETDESCAEDAASSCPVNSITVE
jgi:ferredoxin